MASIQRCGVCVYLIVLFLSVLAVAATTNKPAPADRCPPDYRYRVETCVMEAQVAPQAGGGLPLVTEKNKLEELCSRGILQKSIDCLRDIFQRCAGNATRRHELDMLFSIEDWRRGRAELCQDLNLFKKNFDCVSRFGTRISSCILIRTQLFRKAVTDAGALAHKSLHDITCNFAENIVTCLEHPLSRACPLEVVETMTSALHRFLPPACAPAPTVTEAAADDRVGGVGETTVPSSLEDEDDEFYYQDVDIFDIIVEGGDPEN